VPARVYALALQVEHPSHARDSLLKLDVANNKSSTASTTMTLMRFNVSPLEHQQAVCRSGAWRTACG